MTISALVERVGAFHVTDRALKAAQDEIVAALAAGTAGEAVTERYLAAVKRYFAPYEREAQGQLKHVDRELGRLYQLQYNLTAEREPFTRAQLESMLALADGGIKELFAAQLAAVARHASTRSA